MAAFRKLTALKSKPSYKSVHKYQRYTADFSWKMYFTNKLRIIACIGIAFCADLDKKIAIDIKFAI